MSPREARAEQSSRVVRRGSQLFSQQQQRARDGPSPRPGVVLSVTNQLCRATRSVPARYMPIPDACQLRNMEVMKGWCETKTITPFQRPGWGGGEGGGERETEAC